MNTNLWFNNLIIIVLTTILLFFCKNQTIEAKDLYLCIGIFSFFINLIFNSGDNE